MCEATGRTQSLHRWCMLHSKGIMQLHACCASDPACLCVPHDTPQAAAVDAAHAERDAYKLSAQEIQERSKVRTEGHAR